MELSQFLRTYGPSMTYERIESRDDGLMHHNASHYLCTLTFSRGSEVRKMTTPFSMGAAHTDGPTTDDVVDCLASDSAGYENAQDFEDWANEYGYDTDSRMAERTYNTVKQQSEALKTLLGSKLYATLLYDTDRN